MSDLLEVLFQITSFFNILVKKKNNPIVSVCPNIHFCMYVLGSAEQLASVSFGPWKRLCQQRN